MSIIICNAFLFTKDIYTKIIAFYVRINYNLEFIHENFLKLEYCNIVHVDTIATIILYLNVFYVNHNIHENLQTLAEIIQ